MFSPHMGHLVVVVQWSIRSALLVPRNMLETNKVKQRSFGGSSLLCFRGVTAQNSVFQNGEELQSFLSLSESGVFFYKVQCS